MGETLLELEQSLRSKQGNFTSQEANVLMKCKSNAMKDFTVGGAVGGSLAWLATRGMRSVHRINVSAGVAAICGFWRFGRSLDSCVEHILALDGSRMQKELANIIVNKHQGDHWTMQLITKHFYLERVFDDTVMDQPKLRWRYRAFFGDQISNSQSTSDNNSDNNASDSEGAEEEDSDGSKQVYARYPAIDPSNDPFDLMFGVSRVSEEIHHAATSSTQQRRRQHGHKRSHRRDRMRHHKASTGLHTTNNEIAR